MRPYRGLWILGLGIRNPKDTRGNGPVGKMENVNVEVLKNTGMGDVLPGRPLRTTKTRGGSRQRRVHGVVLCCRRFFEVLRTPLEPQDPSLN